MRPGKLTLNQRIEIISAMESGKVSQQTLAKNFGVSRQTISKIMSKKDEFRENAKIFPGDAKRICPPRFSQVDQATLEWHKEMKEKGNSVTVVMLQESARKFARMLGHTSFQASPGWVARFKMRLFFFFFFPLRCYFLPNTLNLSCVSPFFPSPLPFIIIIIIF